MTVTVIGQDKKHSKQVTCSACGAILKYYPTDVVTHTYRDHGGFVYIIKSINCPTCKNTVVL